MTLNPYYPTIYKLHDSNITFCTKCGGQNDKEITSKTILQLVNPINLTNATLLAYTKLDR